MGLKHAVCVMSVLAIAVSSLAAEEEVPAVGDGGIAAWKTDTPKDYIESYQRVIEKATAEELLSLVNHKDRGVALAAAWERVRRTQQMTTDSNNVKKLVPGPGAIDRFLGVVEGRIQVRISKYWEADLQTTEIRPEGYAVFDWLENTNPAFKPDHTKPPLVIIRQDGKHSVLEDANHAWSIPVEENAMPFDPLIVTNTKDMAYVAVYDSWPVQYKIHAIRKDSSSETWSAEIWAGENILGWLSGASYHHVDLEIHDHELIVVGVAGLMAYIEGFDVTNGKNLFRFNTMYFDPELK